MSAPFDLSGKVALVTGAARGIGAACARALAAAGAEVALNDLAAGMGADDVAAQITAEGGRAFWLPFDVTQSAAVNQGFAALAERCGGLDILVNNAGGRFDDLALIMKDEQWHSALRLNLDSVFYCCRAALKLMRKRGGSIVNVSSVAAFAGSIGQANYAAAKAGVVGLTRSLALEYGSRSIRVNCVVPGIIDTPMTSDISEGQRAELMRRIPLGRFGQPEEVAWAVLFLASPAAAYITGAAVHLNGGGYPA